MTTQVPERPADAATTGATAVMDTARDEGRAVTDAARQETSRLANEARRELRDQSQAQVERLAGGVRDLGRQLHRMAEGEGRPEGPVADLVREAAGRADGLAQRIESEGIDGLVFDIKQFARRRPGMFLGGAFAVGIVAGRMFRNIDTRSVAEAARPESDDDTDATLVAGTDPRPGAVPEYGQPPFATTPGQSPASSF
jgi:hypothetical protein